MWFLHDTSVKGTILRRKCGQSNIILCSTTITLIWGGRNLTAEDVRRCTYDITIFGRHRWTRFPIYIVGIGSCVSISSIPSLLRLHVRIYIYMLPKFLIYCHRQYFSVYTFVCPLLWLTTAINRFPPLSIVEPILFCWVSCPRHVDRYYPREYSCIVLRDRCYRN